MSISTQFKGVLGSKPFDTNSISKNLKTSRTEAANPTDNQLRVSYGIVADVDSETNRVRIDLSSRGRRTTRLGAGSHGSQDGVWIPLLQPLEVIHMMFGALRKGLLARVWWQGKSTPGKDAVAEIISSLTLAELVAGSQEARSNELTTGPHDIFTGGVDFDK